MRSRQIRKPYRALRSKGTHLTRRVPYEEIVAISQPSNRGVITSELRRKIYRKKANNDGECDCWYVHRGGLQDTS